MRKAIGSILALVLLLCLASACGNEADSANPQGKSPAGDEVRAQRRIVFAVDPNWPPMEFLDKNGLLVGFSIDYFNAAGQIAGFEPVFKVLPWDGIFDGLADGRYDAVCSSVSITKERKAKMDFSEPYFRVRQALVVRKEAEYRNLADLEGRKVGVQADTTGAFAVRKFKRVEMVARESVGEAMAELLAGTIDAVVCDDPVAANFAMAQAEYEGRLKIAAFVETDEVEYYGVAVEKGDREVLAPIDRGIAGVKATGLDKELLKKWIGQ
jgi:polar amino acid transport system substrate-binding protein